MVPGVAAASTFSCGVPPSVKPRTAEAVAVSVIVSPATGMKLIFANENPDPGSSTVTEVTSSAVAPVPRDADALAPV